MRTTDMHHEYSYIVLRKHTYYYSRRVPLDMPGQYKSKRIVVSLRTHSKRAALRGSQQVSIQLENHWSAIRVQEITNSNSNSIINQTRKPQLSVDFDGYLMSLDMRYPKLSEAKTKCAPSTMAL